jgi:hypothetical protein
MSIEAAAIAFMFSAGYAGPGESNSKQKIDVETVDAQSSRQDVAAPALTTKLPQLSGNVSGGVRSKFRGDQIDQSQIQTAKTSLIDRFDLKM